MPSTREDASMTRYVRLLGTRRDAYVEFEFSLGDPDLAVELVLPFDEFMTFCRRYEVTFLEPDPSGAAAFERLSWHRGAPDTDILKAHRRTTRGSTR